MSVAKVLRAVPASRWASARAHEGQVRDLADYDRAFGLIDGSLTAMTDAEVAWRRQSWA